MTAEKDGEAQSRVKLRCWAGGLRWEGMGLARKRKKSLLQFISSLDERVRKTGVGVGHESRDASSDSAH